jgi:hypothetical protein
MPEVFTVSPVSRNKKARPPGYAFPRIHLQNIIFDIIFPQVIGDLYLAMRSRAPEPALSEAEGVSAHFSR